MRPIGMQSIFDRKRMSVRVYLARFQYDPFLPAILHMYLHRVNIVSIEINERLIKFL